MQSLNFVCSYIGTPFCNRLLVAAAGDATSASGGDSAAAANSVDDEARMTFKIPNIGPQVQ